MPTESVDCPTPLGFLEIAALLGVKSNTVNMWRWKKLMPEPDHVSVNGHAAYDPETILRWAAETGRLYTDTARTAYIEVVGEEPPPIPTRTKPAANDG